MDALSGRFGSSDLKCFAQTELTIDVAPIRKKFAATAAMTLAVVMLCTSCGSNNEPASFAEEYSSELGPPLTAAQVGDLDEPDALQYPWSEEDVEAMVLTLAGECYDDKPDDKRLVCEVILNRVSSDGFDDTIYGVLTAPNQFDGYWSQSRAVSENDYDIVMQALKDWYGGDCQPLSQWLFFEAGNNRENEFREEFK